MKKYKITQSEYDMLINWKHICTNNSPKKFVDFKYYNPSNESDLFGAEYFK